MVMAANEAAQGTSEEESPSVRLQWLRQRCDALQEKLAQKNNELKNLCIEEAELTGVLPPEIPLEPGESPPSFRRRVGTAFTYPQNLINKLKSNGAEESALELERQVQIGIVEAALGIVNDPTESKAVRRKHRLVYQQGQKRLQELEARLNALRQTRSKINRATQYQNNVACNSQMHAHNNIKHRTKKPRPPLDSTGNEHSGTSTKGVIQEGSINVTSVGIEQKYSSYEEAYPIVRNHIHNSNAYCSTSPVEQRHNDKVAEHDFNDNNHNIYILPDQYRTRTYSHGSGSGHSQQGYSQSHYQDSEWTCRPVPNTYTEEERQIRYRQLQQQKQQELQEELLYNRQQHSCDTVQKQLEHETQRKTGQAYYEREVRSSQHGTVYTNEYQLYNKNQAQLQSAWQRRDRDASGSRKFNYGTGPPADSHLPPGYWMRYDDEIVWCPEEQSLLTDRFGSLDRRKRNALQHMTAVNSEAHSRYRTVTVGIAKNSPGAVSYQHSPVHLLSEQTQANNKILLRTQSLGSVETWHSARSQESHEGKDSTDNVSRRSREKEWYETSLDAATTNSPLDPNLLATTPYSNARINNTGQVNNQGNSTLEITSFRMEARSKMEMCDSRSNEGLRESPMRYEHQCSKALLEIPAESKRLLDENEETISMRSPPNCTIVQAGKYQPYREVTKPFEMSDFYKYSTKFRKRNEMSGRGTLSENNLDNRAESGELAPSVDVNSLPSNSMNYLQNGNVSSPVQKRVYQPVERMTCQPYLTTMR